MMVATATSSTNTQCAHERTATARSRTTPEVLTEVHEAPCTMIMARPVSPMTNASGLRRSKKPPANSPSSVDGDAAHDVAESHAEQERRDGAAQEERQVPAAEALLGPGRLLAVVQRHGPEDEAEEHQHHAPGRSR